MSETNEEIKGTGGKVKTCRKCKDEREKKRAYYQANRERILAQKKAYNQANREKIAERKKAHYHANREKDAAQRKARYQNNREEVLAQRKAYGQANREKRASYAKAYHAANKEKISAQKKAYSQANKEKIAAKNKAYYAANKEKANEQNKAYIKKRRSEDSIFDLKLRCRRRLSHAFASRGFKKTGKTADMLGCDWEFLKSHIEAQFTKGMTWENRDRWHVDHIIPLASANTPEDIMRLSHFSNLQPLWAEENLAKSDKIVDCQPELTLKH
mgnify:CR=1 FL=1